MARLWSSGFELNSSAANVEWTAAQGTALTIQSSVVRSGGYAGQATSLASGTRMGLRYQFAAVDAAGPFYYRVYFRVATAPTASNRILAISNSAAANLLSVHLDNNLKLALRNQGNTQVGSLSTTISPNTWYRLELLFNSTGGAGASTGTFLLDGVQVATSAALTYTTGASTVHVGGNLAAEAQTTGNWYFDDIAVNDSTGSFQTSYPGSGNILHLKPNATGDTNGFLVTAGGTVGAANNFTRVQEVPPDDATTYNGSALLNAEDLFNVDNSGIGTSDTINVVAVGARFADLVAADATSGVKFEIEKTSGGTKAQSATTIPNTTTWNTNGTAAPRNYPLTTYQNPDGAAWTQATVDSMQIGYILTAVAVRAVAVSTIWALVEFDGITTTKTQAGVARVITTTSQSTSGKSRVGLTSSAAQTGRSRLLTLVAQVQQGVSRITAAATRVALGLARITASSVGQAQGKSRVQAQSQVSATGSSRVQVTSGNNLIGKSRITVAVSSTSQGKARVTSTLSIAVNGKASMAAESTAIVVGRSAVFIMSTRQTHGTAAIVKVKHPTNPSFLRQRVLDASLSSRGERVILW